MRKLLYIALALLLVAACGPRKIPREEMEQIMAEMLVQDQQIKQDKNLKKQADTSLVYEGIFEAYGYDTDDFLYSLEYYLENPARMEKIMGAVGSRLEKEAKLVAAEIDLRDWRKGLLRIYNMQVDTTKRPRPRVRLVDTLWVRFEGDSVYLYNIDSISIKDLDSLLFPPVDSTAVDSTAVADTAVISGSMVFDKELKPTGLPLK